MKSAYDMKQETEQMENGRQFALAAILLVIVWLVVSNLPQIAAWVWSLRVTQ